MSHARQILPGTTYLITRRALRRHMLFRPDPEITQFIVYSLAVLATRYRIQVHALCAMSTHLHLVVTDVEGQLPRFLQCFHRLVALGTKVIRKWEGAVFDDRPTSRVCLTTPEAIVEKIAYTLANPVAAGIVRRADEWPGAKCVVEELGSGTLRVARPKVYFDVTNPDWPEEAALSLDLPPTVTEGHAESLRRQVAALVEAAEAKAAADTPPEGVLGAERALEVSPEARATSPEPPLGERNPTFAAGSGNKEGWQRATAALRSFRAAYRAALEQWRGAVRDVVFPVGTWWMRVFHGARVADCNSMS